MFKTAVVIPAYKVADKIGGVIRSVPASIGTIIVVDDKCPQYSGDVAAATEGVDKDRLVVLYNDVNMGVGGAVISGLKKAIELGCDIIVKMDGDGQMDAAYIDELIAPLLKGEADYTKGNRFMNFTALKAMPKVRLFGNSVLSFLLKISSGYWNIIDPTNGYTAIHRRAVEKLNLEQIARRYFFESDMLINLNIINAVVMDIDIPARYGDEESSLSILRTSLEFPPRLLRGLIRRIFFKYFLYDFNMASIYIIIGLPMFVFGVVFGLMEWMDSLVNATVKTSGTIMLVALPIIVSFQMLLQAIAIDIASVPKKNK
ncbi:glycosyltransferase family 2 protein [Candidatus Magnetobacterium casense]|uniref:glycosyltransferase family 2 protein n=1 Tax=Candidatus Magnetobacterium casense TaxID=1455061 RepID=UPI00058AD5D8|nr:glycosyltransferase family 2 protein [Candidatus Magnetobacterium casensis]